MKNLDIRIMVNESKLRYQDIAQEMGISRVWLSNLMKRDLTPANKIRIMAAIERLNAERSTTRD